MTTFAPHRDTLESFVDCIHGGVDNDVLTRLLAEDVVLCTARSAMSQSPAARSPWEP
jgi:hypothetical protein